MQSTPLLSLTDSGLFCPAGNFYIDPWEPVDKALVTHAHADHARAGSAAYLAAAGNERLLRSRLGDDAHIETMAYGEVLTIDGVRVSFHPAGHILGSAQVKVERRGQVWVVSGDYKLDPDPTCVSFEPVACDTFITEATYGLPIYRWPEAATVMEQINAWWRLNQSRRRCSVLFCYALGKAQRILAGVDCSIGPIYTHGAVERLTRDYRQSGVRLPATTLAGAAPGKTDWSKALILAPPSAMGTPWLRRFGSLSIGFASGWMTVRGMRRRRAIDRGFVLSDHADWMDLHAAITASGAGRVLVTHGYVPQMVRYLSELGLDALAVSTRFEGEAEETAAFSVANAREEALEESNGFAAADAAVDAAMVAEARGKP